MDIPWATLFKWAGVFSGVTTAGVAVFQWGVPFVCGEVVDGISTAVGSPGIPAPVLQVVTLAGYMNQFFPIRELWDVLMAMVSIEMGILAVAVIIKIVDWIVGVIP